MEFLAALANFKFIQVTGKQILHALKAANIVTDLATDITFTVFFPRSYDYLDRAFWCMDHNLRMDFSVGGGGVRVALRDVLEPVIRPPIYLGPV